MVLDASHAGVSYGQYARGTPQWKDFGFMASTPARKGVKICTVCGRVMSSFGCPSQIYCSAKCKSQAKYAREMERKESRRGNWKDGK